MDLRRCEHTGREKTPTTMFSKGKLSRKRKLEPAQTEPSKRQKTGEPTLVSPLTQPGVASHIAEFLGAHQTGALYAVSRDTAANLKLFEPLSMKCQRQLVKDLSPCLAPTRPDDPCVKWCKEVLIGDMAALFDWASRLQNLHPFRTYLNIPT